MDLSQVSTVYLFAVFAVCAAVIWFSGVRLAGEIDRIDKYFGLGEDAGDLSALENPNSVEEIAVAGKII